MNERIWLIVLAAGHSTRMGKPKMLLPVHGESLLRSIVKKAMPVGKVAVVLRREGHEEAQQLADLPVTLLHPPFNETAMSDSLRTAIQYCIESDAAAAIILLGDQPGIDPAVIRRLVSLYKVTKNPIIQPNYRDGPGHPILFDRTLFSELLKVTGDQGARNILKSYASKRLSFEVNDNQPMDLDTLEDYQTYIRIIKN